MSSSTAGVAGSVGSSSISDGIATGNVRKPVGAHVRAESFTSKYSSGVSGTSLRGWADPGPDVGPGAKGGEGGEEERLSGGSRGSVGRAM